MVPTAQDSRHKRHKEPQRIRTGPRMMVACIYCKERKLKCDNNIPACANCCRLKLTCVVEDPITKRHQPRNYLEILETRVAHLEYLLHNTCSNAGADNVSLDTSLDSAPSNTATSISVSPRASIGILNPSGPLEKDDSDVNDLAAKVGMLGLNAAGIEPHYLGSSSAFAFSRAIGSSLLFRDVKPATSNAETQAGSCCNHSHSLSDSSALLPCALPCYEDGLVLSNAYFQNIHIQYPFLHEPTFRMWEAQMASPLLATSSDPEVALFFVYMVYAVGALLLPDNGHCHKQLYLAAQLYMDGVLQRDNLQSIQAILSCAMYSLRSPTGPSLWKLTGFCLRQCIELGYHRDAKCLGSVADELQLDLRKRAFWCAFSIDCSVAIMLGRPLGIPLQEIDVEFPNIDSFDTPEAVHAQFSTTPTSISVAIQLFRLRCLWAKIHGALFSDTRRMHASEPAYNTRIKQLREELEEWHATSPPEFARSGHALSLFGSKDWYEVNYSNSILLLHRNHLIDTRGAVPDHIVLECLDAAENISRGYHRQFISGRVGYTWGALHFLFLAGLTYLHCLWTSPAARRSRPWDAVSNMCMDCSMVLVVMAERWSGAGPYRDIFEALSKKTIRMVMTDQDPLLSEWPSSFGTSSIVECGNLEDPWEIMQWISGDLLAPESTERA